MVTSELTVGELSKASGLSRSALLYYDRLGLLKPSGRSHGNYRLYSAEDVHRLDQICLYRKMGIPLKEIAQLLDDEAQGSAAAVLQRRLKTLSEEIATLRSQQQCIVAILKQSEFHKEIDVMNKDRWVEIMQAAGMSDDMMKQWHVQFEKMEPEAHQEFLEHLKIDSAEIAKIREWSRNG